MIIYEYLFDFFYALIGDGSGIYTNLNDFNFAFGGYDISFNEWLIHSFCIISIVLIFIFFIIFIKWLFKLFGGLFKW